MSYPKGVPRKHKSVPANPDAARRGSRVALPAPYMRLLRTLAAKRGDTLTGTLQAALDELAKIMLSE